MNHSIVDVMADSPGGYRPSTYGAASFRANTYLPGYPSDYLFAVVNLNYLQDLVNSTRLTRLYVDIRPDANYTGIMEDIIALAPYSFASIESPLGDIDSILDTRAGQSIYGAYSLNILFSIIYVTAGMTLVMTAKVRKMRKHFSLLRALGTEPGSIIKAVTIDVAIGTALGICIGTAVGYLLTLIVLGIPVTYLGLSQQVSWHGLPVTVAFPFELILGIVIISFAVSVAATYLVMRRGLSIDIAEDLSAAE
jgi:ABC-type antimicrobial peptide transport system permease subunit